MSKALSGSLAPTSKKKPKPKKTTTKASPSSKKTESPARKRRTKNAVDLLPKPQPQAPTIRMRSEPPGPIGANDDLVETYAEKGKDLLQKLEAAGAQNHEYRVDLKEGRFVWVDREGRVSAEAYARALCSYTPATSSLTMAWLDPLLASSSVAPISRLASEYDDVDEEAAWRIAIAAAAVVGADYLYRVEAPNVWYFLSLTGLSFQPLRVSFTPSSPTGLVLSEIHACRKSLRTGAEPASVIRDRLTRIGNAFTHEAEYAYRGTDWVARLARAGKRLTKLASSVPVPSFDAVAQGKGTSEWVSRERAEELDQALRMLEDEWRLFT